MDVREKVRMTFDYLFGRGIGLSLPLSELQLVFSKRTEKLRKIHLEGELLATFRSDGGVALTVAGAKLLIKDPKMKSNCVVIDDSVKAFVMEGRSVFCKHVRSVGNMVRAKSEVVVLDSKGEVLAVGKAVLSAKMIRSFKVGVAVKIRKGALEKKSILG